MSSTNTDVSVHFTYPTLDKIHGEPSYESLKTIKQQLKANAQSLGPQTNYGYLGLVLSPQEFQQISNVAFTRPTDPGHLNIPAFTPAHEALIRQSRHAEEKNRFRECNLVEQALKRQLVAALDEEYVRPFKNVLTNNVTVDIPYMLERLFSTYGKVTPDQLRRAEERVNTYVWRANDAPDVLYNMIEELVFISEAANLPKTNNQIVNYGLEAIRKTGEYERALMSWYEKAEGDQTWSNFKTHFTEAQNQLRRVRGSTMHNTPFHQANLALQEEVRNDFQRMRDEVVNSLNMIAQDFNRDEEQQPPTTSNQAATFEASMNAATVQNQAIMQALGTLTSQMNNMETRINSMNAAGNGGGNGGNNAPPNDNNNRGPYRGRRIITHYCWSHGACGHPGRTCRNPKPGHKNEATFANRMGGSNYYCRQVMDNQEANGT